MTEHDNQNTELLINMIRGLEKQSDQIRITQKEDRTEWRKTREEDRAEMRHLFEEQKKAREKDLAEMHRLFEEQKKNREEDRTEWRRGFDEMKYDLRLDKEKLEKVYEARNQVTVGFSRAFATTNAFIAGIIAVLVSLFMNVDK